MSLFGRASLFRGAPGPSPWYLRTDPPEMPGFHWEEAGSSACSSGLILLRGPQGVAAIFDFYNYTLRLGTHELLVWRQRQVRSGPTAPVTFQVIDPAAPPRLEGDVETLCAAMKAADTAVLMACAPAATFVLATTQVDEDLHADFPRAVRGLDELLVLCHSSGIEDAGQSSNLALLVAAPSAGTYRLYPQDWFNTGGLDYGYQWVTRVVRSPRTRRIHGEGIRIDPFVLDKTLRQRALF